MLAAGDANAGLGPAAVVRVYLSDRPDAPQSTWVSRYEGTASRLYAFVVVDSVPESSFLSGFSCRLAIDNLYSRTRIRSHSLAGGWRELDPTGGQFGQQPSLPGVSLPAVIGTWELALDDSVQARAFVRMGCNRLGDVSMPVLLDERGAPSRAVRVYPASIHHPVFPPHHYPLTGGPIPQRLDEDGHPIPGRPAGIDPEPGVVHIWLARGLLAPISPARRPIDLSEIGSAAVRELLAATSPTSILRSIPEFNSADTVGTDWSGHRISIPDFSRWITVTYSGTTDPDTLANSLNAASGVIVAEPDFPLTPQTTPNDSFYVNPPQGLSRWHLERIGMPDVWPAYALPDPSWRIGIIDKGVKWQHPDLGELWGPTHKIVGGWNYVTGGQDFTDYTSYPYQCGYHGTNVAGDIGSLTNNTYGIASPAGGWSPDRLGPRLVIFKVIDDNTCVMNSDSLTRAILATNDPTKDYDCKVFNMSVGKDVYSEQNRAACITAYRRGALIVAARGNNTSNDDADSTWLYPACYDRHCVLSCGASDTADVRLHVADHQPLNHYYRTTSRYAGGVDLVAPGHRMTTIDWDYPDNQPSFIGDWGATSAAAPLCTAAAALVAMRGAALGPEDLQGLLKAGCADVETDPVGGNIPGADIYTGAGRLDVAKSFSFVATPYAVIHASSDPSENYDYGYPTDVWDDMRTFIGIPGLPETPQFVYVNRIRNEITPPIALGGSDPLPAAWGVGARSNGASLADPNYGEGYAEVSMVDPWSANGVTYIYQIFVADSLWGYFPSSYYDTVMGYSAVGTPIDPSATPEAGAREVTRLEVRGSPGPQPVLEAGGIVGNEVGIRIYDPAGRLVRAEETVPTAGRMTFRWDGRDNGGHSCPTGMYFGEIRAKGQCHRTRLVLIR